MNSRPVNYSPLLAARFAGFLARNCDWFSVACPRREITNNDAVCTLYLFLSLSTAVNSQLVNSRC